MNYNFTDRLRAVLEMAREEAVRLHHDYVGTEHLLLGLIREGEGVAAAVLSAVPIDLRQMRGRIEHMLPEGRVMVLRGELPYTSRAKKVLEFAAMESRELDHSYIGTEHLLLGLLREEKGIAAQVLHEFGLSSEDARRRTLQLLASDPDATERIRGSRERYDDIVVVHLTNGEIHRVRERPGPSARDFAEHIGRRGVWVTGAETFFVPVTAIARIQLYSPEAWEKMGLES